MGLEQSIKAAVAWSRREPAIYLAGVLNWIPGLVFSIVAVSAAPWIRDIIASNSKNPLSAIMAHSQEILGLIVPLLGLLVALVIVAVSAKAWVALALAHAAKQFHQGETLSLRDAFAAARKRWLSLIVAEIWLLLIVLAITLLAVLITVVLIISIVGIIVLAILAIPAGLALIVGGIAVAAAMLFLPPILAFTESGAWDGLKSAFRFVDQHKMASAGLVLLAAMTQMILSAIVNALGGPMGSVLELLVQLFVGTLSALVATGYWLDAQKTENEKREEKEKPESKAEKTDTTIREQPKEKTKSKKAVPKKTSVKGKK
ncbi:hypothetical protein HY994_01910 [Candidatus Micrarchaeota archaeon]|nr:hypothetical protein [Candidatus Micrarchaeota archaeon]